MSINPPNVPPFNRPLRPITHITPFTYRDGHTFLELIEQFREYINTMVPQVQGIMNDWYVQYVRDYGELVDDVNQAKQLWEQFFADFRADVVAQIAVLNDEAVAELVDDPSSEAGAKLREAVADLVDDPSSEAGAKLREIFELRSRANTKDFEGTPLERLHAALATGSPVQLDENIAHNNQNIPDFWERRIYGTGVIELPNGDTFHPDPHPKHGVDIVNKIYVDSHYGLEENDGLTPQTPLNSLWSAYHKVLQNLTAQQAAGAQWDVHLKGVFNDETPLMDGLQNFPRGLNFIGEPLVADKPVTEMRYPGTGRQMGVYIEPGVEHVTVSNIHFRGYKVGFNGYGILMKFGGKLTVKNCEFTDNDIGVAAIQGTSFSIVDNKFNPGHNTAISTQYNATGHANRNVMDGGGVEGGVGGDTNGVRFSRGVNAHFDDNIVRGYIRGMYVDMASRVASPGNTFGRCETGVVVSSAAEWNNDGNTFEPTNTEHYRHDGAGREVRLHSEGVHKALDYRFFTAHSLSSGAHRSLPTLESRTMVYNTGSLEFPGQWFENPGKTITFKLAGELKDHNGYTVTIEIGTVKRDGSDWVPLSTISLPAGSNDVGGFVVESTVHAVSQTAQTSESVAHGRQTRAFVNESTTDFSTDRLFRVYARATGGSPVSIVFTALDIYVAG